MAGLQVGTESHSGYLVGSGVFQKEGGCQKETWDPWQLVVPGLWGLTGRQEQLICVCHSWGNCMIPSVHPANIWGIPERKEGDPRRWASLVRRQPMQVS